MRSHTHTTPDILLPPPPPLHLTAEQAATPVRLTPQLQHEQNSTPTEHETSTPTPGDPASSSEEQHESKSTSEMSHPPR